ncbi:heparinase II/III family protein [Jiella sp. M17.18]|uniref:heparinase II/III family protein n=1 Tax=Jiella sp. M17.18 TaxID=3234247 RepID=UPI0034DF3B2F
MSQIVMDKPLLAALTLQEAWRRVRRRLRTGPIHRWRFAGAVPAQLLVIPPSLRHGDPLIAEAIYGGRFYFAGRLVELSEGSIFQVPTPSEGFAAKLHGFSWLRHHAAAGDALAAHNARALLGDWMRLSGAKLSGPAFEPEVTARRLIAWMSYADLLLGDADHRFYRRFMKSLSAQARFLRLVAAEAPDGTPRLMVRMALALASLCLPTSSGRIRAAAQNLADELDRQIFPDGGHVSRDPSALVAILAELLPLRETYLGQGQPIPKGIYSAIDRMLPALRFFRHGDGSLALFNGAGVSDLQLMTALLRFDETLGEPLSNARQSGYHRLAAGGTVVIADTGRPPPAPVSHNACAGTLAFELSSGSCRIVVNCGRPVADRTEWRRLSRATAAHSTVVLDDHSSSRFAPSKSLDRFLGNPLVPGPTRIDITEPQATDGSAGEGEGPQIGFTATHDGYEREFGLTHSRTIALSPDGTCVSGEDRLIRTRRGRLHGHPLHAAARFHLHPGVSVEQFGREARLTMRGQVWRFTADLPFSVEDSILFADSAGARRTLQIVIPFEASEGEEIAWRFSRER